MIILPLLLPLSIAQQKPQVHPLPATPETVAYGFYWSQAKPAITIPSGDIIEVETLLTNTPTRLEAAGVPAEEVQASLRSIVEKVTDKGPGGHILTGPVFVEGAEPGDVLEVKILEIGYSIGYGYNGCSGFIRDLCADPQDPDHPARHGEEDRGPGERDHRSAQAVFREHGGGAAARFGSSQQQSTGHSRGQPR